MKIQLTGALSCCATEMAAALATAALIGRPLPLLLLLTLLLLSSLGGGDDEFESVTLPLDMST